MPGKGKKLRTLNGRKRRTVVLPSRGTIKRRRRVNTSVAANPQTRPPRTHVQCCACKRRITSNGWSRAIGGPGVASDEKSLWKIITVKLGDTRRDFQETDRICKSCHGKLRFDFERNGLQNFTIRQSHMESTVQGEVDMPNTDDYSQGTTISMTPSEIQRMMEYSQGTTISMTPSDIQRMMEYSQGTTISMTPSQTILDNSQESFSMSMSQTLSSSTQLSQASTSISVSSSQSISIKDSQAKISIPSVSKSESRCFLCKSTSGRTRVPESAMLQVLQRHFIYIPPKNRTCAINLKDGLFTPKAMNQITADKQTFMLSGEKLTKWVTSLVKSLNQKVTIMDFGKNSQLNPEDFHLLLGINRDQFLEIVQVCRGHVHASANRSVENAVAIFFMKMRLDLSQKVLALLFGIENQQRVSEIITHVGEVLDREFVPKNLGCGESHLNRGTAATHDSDFFRRILESPPESLHLTCDATYLYIQKPSNHELQLETYSLHKSRNLVKPMLVVFADGYILDSDGPWFSDAKNNDSDILSRMLDRTGLNSLANIIQIGDVFIVDRGFRDVIAKLVAMGYTVFMPELLKGKSQFSTLEANVSRKVTMLRLIVEVVNGELKQRFRFLDSTIQATYMAKIPMFFRVTCAIHNKYGTRFRKAPEDEDYIVEKVLSEIEHSNKLETFIEEKGLLRKKVCWKTADEADLEGFPVLSMDDLKKITLGTFQIKMADRYSNRNLDDEGEYRIFVHRENATLFRVKLQSRFSRRAIHQVWVEVEAEEQGYNAITAYYCTCKTGSRTLGCCSHVCSVLKYAGHDRHQPPTTKRRSRVLSFLDAAIDLGGDDEDEDQDDN